MTNFVIASSKDWFDMHQKSDSFRELNLFYIKKKEDLTLEYLEKINPRYVFFTHWNWVVQPDIYQRFECVVFHTAPLPYGRGGSPIQNMILNGFKSSPVCALRMSSILDGGPIYASLDISLDGTINDIFRRISCVVEKLIVYICEKNPTPVEQVGTPTLFKRLTVADNELLNSYSLMNIYDRIRMVDGEDYPKAYIIWGDYKIEFSNASVESSELMANVRIVNKYKYDIKVRKAIFDDSADIFEWRNNPESRAMFTSTDIVSFDTHQAWFSSAVQNPARTLYIGETQKNKLGICRFDLNSKTQSAEISINLNPNMRGKGLSKIFLQNAIEKYLTNTHLLLTATIRKTNEASIKLFIGCGFRQIKEDENFFYFSLNK